ncbi:MAG: hypothetical protein ACFFDT_36430 [Candidatus Hodarchaeota archaeon]
MALDLIIPDILIILIGIHASIGVLLWWLDFIRQMRVYYRQYDILENSSYDIENLREFFARENIHTFVDIKVFSSSRAHMMFFGGNVFPKQFFHKSTLLISTGMFSDPFTSQDRLGLGVFLLYYIQRFKHNTQNKRLTLNIWQSRLIILIASVVLFFFLNLYFPAYTMLEVSFFWIMILFFLVLVIRYKQILRVYEADRYAVSLVSDYPRLVEKATKEALKQTSGMWKIINLIMALSGNFSLPSLKNRLKRMRQSEKIRSCPLCEEPIRSGFSWCIKCQNKLLKNVSYSGFMGWSVLAVILIGWVSGLTIKGLGELNTYLEDNVSLLSIVFGFFILIIFGFLTYYFHFRQIFVKKPNFIVLTLVLGVSIFLGTIISVGPAISMNYARTDPLIDFLFSPLFGYIFGGFLIYYFIVENRFKNSEIQQRFSRCPVCTHVLSKTDNTCPDCNHVIHPQYSKPVPIPPYPLSSEPANSQDLIRYCIKCGVPRIDGEKVLYCISCGMKFPIIPSSRDHGESEKRDAP